MKQLDQLDPVDLMYKPLYLSSNHNRDKRKIVKFVNKQNWFIQGNGSSSHPWRLDVPQELRKQVQIKRNRNSGIKLILPLCYLYPIAISQYY